MSEPLKAPLNTQCCACSLLIPPVARSTERALGRNSSGGCDGVVGTPFYVAVSGNALSDECVSYDSGSMALRGDKCAMFWLCSDVTMCIFEIGSWWVGMIIAGH
jgi:hypothetical protein